MKSIVRLIKAVKRHGFKEIASRAPRLYYTKYKLHRSPIILKHRGNIINIYHRKTHDDLLGIWQCFKISQYEIPKPMLCEPYHRNYIDKLYNKIVSDGDTPLIIDCGANIGAGSLWFLSRYPGAHIVAVEPNTSNIQLLKKNLRNKSADIIEGAVVRDDQSLTFVDTGSTLANQIADYQNKNPNTYRVDGYSLKSIVEKSTKKGVLFILKIDIEGAEKIMFDNPEYDADKFPVVILEPHDFMIPGEAISANFFKFHSKMEREFLFWEENIFSIKSNVFKDIKL